MSAPQHRCNFCRGSDFDKHTFIANHQGVSRGPCLESECARSPGTGCGRLSRRCNPAWRVLIFSSPTTKAARLDNHRDELRGQRWKKEHRRGWAVRCSSFLRMRIRYCVNAPTKCCHRPRERAIQYSQTFVGRRGCPAFAGHDAVGAMKATYAAGARASRAGS